MWRSSGAHRLRIGQCVQPGCEAGADLVARADVGGCSGWSAANVCHRSHEHHLVFGPPKTRSGERRLDLDGGTVAELRSWKVAQGQERWDWQEAYEDSGLVFTDERGHGIHPERVTVTFLRLVQAAGVRRIRFHDLRHGSASLQLAAGVDLAVVSKRLGHSTVALTSDTYSHLIGGVGKQAAEASAALVPRRAREA